MKKKEWLVITAVVVMVGLLCGCTVSNGVFTGMSQQSSETSLSSSYVSFDGSLARRVSLKSGDEVSFSLEGGEGLQAVVKKDGEVICDITDGTTLTVNAEGSYLFTLQGEAKNGAFTLSWTIE